VGIAVLEVQEVMGCHARGFLQEKKAGRANRDTFASLRAEPIACALEDSATQRPMWFDARALLLLLPGTRESGIAKRCYSRREMGRVYLLRRRPPASLSLRGQ